MSSGFNKCSKTSFLVQFPLFHMVTTNKFICLGLIPQNHTGWLFNLHSNSMLLETWTCVRQLLAKGQKAKQRKPTGGDSGWEIIIVQEGRMDLLLRNGGKGKWLKSSQPEPTGEWLIYYCIAHNSQHNIACNSLWKEEQMSYQLIASQLQTHPSLPALKY